MAESNIFELKNVNKVFVRSKEQVGIFDNLNLNIKKGDFVAIMGPSGSGKTTLLNLLGGVDQVTGGSILFNGDEISGLSESRLSDWRAQNVGFIFQFYNLMPMLSAEQNVELPLLLKNMPGKERKRKVSAALELVGLKERAKHKPSELSGGQQQRIAIARAIISDPNLLLCDEPTGDLDRKTATAILGLLQTLNKDFGKTIIMVTHDPEAAGFANNTLHLNKGVFMQESAEMETAL
ncbi:MULTISPECIES: ABC transporter ATP-binding protein [unclassified Pseudoalteromonas]|uniref:ABC transporter ATP-binding protein n=1 Tax=unclassified Pseudoalteromonas TaxID=194690 RepID=UPI0025B2F624|nr:MULTISPECIES: ABC transporter ATP-binding protein [unclassified Pseudoalteromonas]MDN3379166.1 ABC transporter ATP-binding protein [Pseudoalteromonas sp. APC 3893]MDN3387661.1 ABC transporter ATP-binding protein [Pseudoalteromonas sp. APC 4017]